MLRKERMKLSFSTSQLDPKIPTAQLIADLHEALDRSYRQIRAAARLRWECFTEGRPDPSDACVSIRIAPRPAAVKRLATAGVLPKRKSGFSVATNRPLLAN